jgi:hypothetical protein
MHAAVKLSLPHQPGHIEWNAPKCCEHSTPQNHPKLVIREKKQLLNDQRQNNPVEGKGYLEKRCYKQGPNPENIAVIQSLAITMNPLVLNIE